MVGAVLNLDQLRVFAMVEQTGSFSAAARVLGRAQSAVTYAIQELEADLRTALFDRSGYRPVLSAAGRAMLPRAKRVLSEVDALQVQADGLATGLEASLSLVVDAAYPMVDLTAALIAFKDAFPSVTTHLHAESLGAGADMVLAGEADLGLIVAPFAPADRLDLSRAGVIELAVVCAPAHPLALRQLHDPRPISKEAAQDHLQLVLSDRSPRTRDQEHGVIASSTWRIADLGAKHAMLRAGLGWGSLPRHVAADDLSTGRLTELRLARWPVTEKLPRLELVLARRPDRALGPAGRWLASRLTRAEA